MFGGWVEEARKDGWVGAVQRNETSCTRKAPRLPVKDRPPTGYPALHMIIDCPAWLIAALVRGPNSSFFPCGGKYSRLLGIKRGPRGHP